MQRHEFDEAFGNLLAYHGRKFNAEMAASWYSRLRIRSTPDVRKAFEEGKANHKAMPTLNEVCTYLPRYAGAAADGEEELRLSPQAIAFNLAVWPHFSDMAAHKISKQEFGLAFKGLAYLHGMTGQVDMEQMSLACGIDLTDGRTA